MTLKTFEFVNRKPYKLIEKNGIITIYARNVKSAWRKFIVDMKKHNITNANKKFEVLSWY